MQGRPLMKVKAIEPQGFRMQAWGLNMPLLIFSLAPLLVAVLIIGVVRFFHSLNDGTISAWRLVALFAQAFGCIMIVCARCGRGRSESPASSPVNRGPAW